MDESGFKRGHLKAAMRGAKENVCAYPSGSIQEGCSTLQALQRFAVLSKTLGEAESGQVGSGRKENKTRNAVRLHGNVEIMRFKWI